MFLVECPGGKRTREVLEKIIVDHVQPGTTIFTDCWAAYNHLEDLGNRLITILSLVMIQTLFGIMLRLHMEVRQPWQVVRGSKHWCSYQPHWKSVCKSFCPSKILKSSCSWFAVKRTLPRGGRFNLSRSSQNVSFVLKFWIYIFISECSVFFQSVTSFLFFNQFYSSYLPVYMWRQLNKVNQKDDFSELLHLMSVKQMQEDASFDNNRVCLEPWNSICAQ